jgi:hypothetical protein
LNTTRIRKLGKMTSVTRLRLRDNGCRSLVPPCYKWDIVDLVSNKVVNVASEVDLSPLGLPDEKVADTYSELAHGVRTVEGHFAPYTVGTSGNGLRFTVTKIGP